MGPRRRAKREWQIVPIFNPLVLNAARRKLTAGDWLACPFVHMLLVAASVHRIGADEEDSFVTARFDGVHLDGHLDLILDHAILGVGPIGDGGVTPEMGDVFDFVTLLWEVLVEHLELGRIIRSSMRTPIFPLAAVLATMRNS